MNAATAILLAVLVHLGGVEVDTTREATLHWYRDSELTGQWELEASRAGAYRFVSDEGLVIVERLREADMTYAVQHYETTQRHEGETTAPIPRTLHALGAVALQPQAQNLIPPRSSRGRVSLDAARIPVAWAQVIGDDSPGEAAEDGEVSNGGRSADDADAVSRDSSNGDGAVGESAPTGRVSVSITPGQWFATLTESGQVMVLQVR
ncbi:MAG: hypothetical protein WD492_01015 [Alkalispirochaeta sp.]